MIEATAPRAHSIAGQLRQSLRAQPFWGYVAGRYARAYNLLDDAGRVIALTTPEIGNGPFYIVLEATAGLFEMLEPRQLAYIDAEQITIGHWRIPLRAARTWDATLPIGGRAIHLSPALAAIVQPYATCPAPAVDAPAAKSTARLLAQGGRALTEALEQRTGLTEAARSLAGLGQGLTPAGDDFLVGAMAALWLLGEHTSLPTIAQASAAYTTAVSGAFLAAAARGQFIEPWHELAQALHRQDETGSQVALRRLAAFGASSGRDALAGFAAVLLRRTQRLGDERLEIRD
jgi:Protein of unknown function (DUF2877)